MELAEIEALHAQHARADFGTTTPDELAYIQETIRTYKPRKILEIGTASGLTTGFLARFLEEVGGDSVTSIDSEDVFFGDHRKKVGYLASAIYDGQSVRTRIEAGKSSLDLAGLDGPWDLVFVDASHNHPWPTLDTLAVAPHLSGARIVIHHDLQLFRRFPRFLGIGPRVLFNETPQTHRHAGAANGWNIFRIDLSMEPVLLEEIGLNALSMPWTARPPLSKREVSRFREALRDTYSPGFWAQFDVCEKQNRWNATKMAYFYVRYAAAKLRNALLGRSRA